MVSHSRLRNGTTMSNILSDLVATISSSTHTIYYNMIYLTFFFAPATVSTMGQHI